MMNPNLYSSLLLRCQRDFLDPLDKLRVHGSHPWAGAYCSVQIDYDIYDSESKIMARSLSSMLLKRIVGLPATRPSRLDVKENPVMIYMKGVPEFPQCGFSSLAVKNVPLASRNILEDPELKSAVKTFSHWPTFPRIFIKGEFIGGSDIILNSHQVTSYFRTYSTFNSLQCALHCSNNVACTVQSGELKEKLKDITASKEKSE
ncbi:hypothetical protein SO802_005699 [Lithocarpus litseifolius]|uniref:Glutaredoxin domain-containing protein n=1 Tax=Lithocarpus litseifolius TaxID=425828 RepID=A0AAW2DNI3_9ROSI